MENQFIIEDKTYEYLAKNNLTLIEKTFWNSGVVAYTVAGTKKGEEKSEYSLITIYLEEENLNLKDQIYSLYNSRNNNLIKCYHVDEIQYGKGKIFFILTEVVNPVIDMILDGKIDLSDKNEEEKKIAIYTLLTGVCDTLLYVKEKHSDLNIYINNEELCIDQNGKSKLLLFDLIKNEMATNNEAYELAYIGRNIAKGLNVKMDIPLLEGTLENLKKVCLKNIALYEKANECNKNKYSKNLTKAIKGDKRSQYIIGYMNEHGKAVPKNIKRAAYWYEKSARKKYTRALNNLAYFYQKGIGVKKNIEKAEELLLISAKQKDGVACLNLAIMYQTGKKGNQNLEQAVVWYKKSMKYGNKTAERMYKRLISQKSK